MALPNKTADTTTIDAIPIPIRLFILLLLAPIPSLLATFSRMLVLFIVFPPHYRLTGTGARSRVVVRPLPICYSCNLRRTLRLHIAESLDFEDRQANEVGQQDIVSERRKLELNSNPVAGCCYGRRLRVGWGAYSDSGGRATLPAGYRYTPSDKPNIGIAAHTLRHR